MTIHPVEAELIHADRHNEAISRFSYFANAPKNTNTIIRLGSMLLLLPFSNKHFLQKLFFKATFER
jgi:hypothetical protein